MSQRCEACTDILRVFEEDLRRLTSSPNDVEKQVGKEMYRQLIRMTTNNIAHIKNVMVRYNRRMIADLEKEIKQIEK